MICEVCEGTGYAIDMPCTECGGTGNETD